MTDGLDGASDGPGSRAGTPELCTHCGDAIDTGEWHPVVARSEGGDFRVYPFCDDSCKSDWDED